MKAKPLTLEEATSRLREIDAAIHELQKARKPIAQRRNTLCLAEDKIKHKREMDKVVLRKQNTLLKSRAGKHFERWEKSDVVTLIELQKTLKDKEIAALLNRTLYSVRARLRNLRRKGII